MQSTHEDDIKSPLLNIYSDESSEADSTFPKENQIDLDEALDLIGHWGKFNILLLVALIISNATLAYQLTFSYFICNNPSWKCELNNRTNTSLFCSLYGTREIRIDNDNYYERCKLPRSEWKYTTDKLYSLVTEFDLVCDKSALGSLASSSFYLGIVVQLILGFLVDYYGRKVVYIPVLVVSITLSFGLSFVKNVWQFIVLRIILGGFLITNANVIYLLLAELTSPLSRGLATSIYFSVSNGFSQLGIDLLAQQVPNWRKLNIFATIPSLVGFIVIFFVPRSARWLNEKGRVREAESVMRKAASLNEVLGLEISLKPPAKNVKRTHTYLDFFTTWKAFRMLGGLLLIYMVIGLLTYQLALEGSQLGVNIYLTYGLLALADIPGQFTVFYFCDRFGRRKTVLISLLVSGMLMGGIALVPHNYANRHTATLVLAFSSKVTSSISNIGVFIWGVELIPTALRYQGGTIAIIVHQLAVVSVPLMSTALHTFSPMLIYVIICLLSVIVSLIGTVLKETNNQPTRETYEDLLNNE